MQYSAEEIKIEDFPKEGVSKECKIYLLVLAYNINRFHSDFIDVYGTDFTHSYNFPKPRATFDHCLLRNNQCIDTSQVVPFDGKKSFLFPFILNNRLPPPDYNPYDSTYEEKILVEVRGYLKRFKNVIDFNKTRIETLNKFSIAERVRTQNDKYLIGFLQRLYKHCPISWRSELFRKYSLDLLLDDLEIIDYDGEGEIVTQRYTMESQAHSKNIHNIRLLPDYPQTREKDLTKYPDNVQQLYRNILKQEESEMDGFEDNSEGPQMPAIDTDGKTNSSLLQTPISNVLNKEDSQENTQNGLLSTTDTQGGIPETQPVNDEFLTNDLTGLDDIKDVRVCGYSPNNEAPLLVKNIATGKYEVVDTFEIYLQLAEDDAKICTLGFKDSENAFRVIFDFENPVIPDLSSSFEEKLRLAVDKKFSSGSSIKVSSMIYEKLNNGLHDLTVSYDDLIVRKP